MCTLGADSQELNSVLSASWFWAHLQHQLPFRQSLDASRVFLNTVPLIPSTNVKSASTQC